MLLSAAEGRLEAGGGEEAGLLCEGERWRRSCAALVWVRGWHGAAAGAGAGMARGSCRSSPARKGVRAYRCLVSQRNA